MQTKQFTQAGLMSRNMCTTLTRWAKTPVGGRVLRTVACALFGVSLGLVANLAAREHQTIASTDAAAVAKGFVLGALPLESLPVGTSLKGELVYGTSLNPVTVYFRTERGTRFKYRLDPGTPGYTTAAFQASFARQAGSLVVPGVELVVEMTSRNARVAAFSRGPEPFLEVGLPG